MNNKITRIAALALTTTITSTCFYGCAEAENGSSSYTDSSSSQVYEYPEYADEESSFEEYCPDDTAPAEPSPNESYAEYVESGFIDTLSAPLSTFSADVDTASYSNVRRLIEDSMTVPEDAVRIEEFINYFDYDYPNPEKGEVFGTNIEIADCPWNSDSKLMRIGIQGERIEDEEAPPTNLVFLIDSSGSMSSYNKLPLVQTAFSMLAEELDENDRISIVTYAGSSCTLIAGADGTRKDEILEALYSITAGGSTNGEGGIQTAYELAEDNFIEGGSNRVILATDGDLNVGASTAEELTKLIESKRDMGIYLSVLGFGTGNIKDDSLEALADNGNGNYSYIDSVNEAQRVLVQEMSGTLHTIAKDVRIQVEFNPSQVAEYRLIGYDNRLMDAHEFVDSEADAGEVGAGHSITALYELILNDNTLTYDGIPLEFADQHPDTRGQLMAYTEDENVRTELCKVSVGYEDIETGEDIYLSDLYGMESYSDTPSDSFVLASSAAQFGMLLRNSEYKGTANYSSLSADIMVLDMENEKIGELYDLIRMAAQ